MRRRLRALPSRDGVVGGVVGALVVLVLSGTALAVTSNSFVYSEPRTGYLMLHPGDLVPATWADGDNSVLHPFEGVQSRAGEGIACHRAPVHLPPGAKMTNLRTWYRSAASDLSWEFGRTNPATGIHDVLVARAITPVEGTARVAVNDAIAAAKQAVGNGTYFYTLTVCVHEDAKWFAGRITYTYTNAGD